MTSRAKLTDLPPELIIHVLDLVAAPTYEGWQMRYRAARSLALVSPVLTASARAVLSQHLFLRGADLEHLARFPAQFPEPTSVRLLGGSGTASADFQSYVLQFSETCKTDELWIRPARYVNLDFTNFSCKGSGI